MYKVSFPHMGKYYIVVKKIAQAIVGEYGEVFESPPITKRTLELGSKHSPEFVCIPFKYNLGNFIETLDNGANFLVMTGGSCRFGFYAEVQEQILRDLDYDFEFYPLIKGTRTIKEHLASFRRINPKFSYIKLARTAAAALRALFAMDKIEEYVRENVGFEAEEGSFERLERQFLAEIELAYTITKVSSIYRKYMKKLKSLPVNKPENPIRVGVVGELYLVMEPFSNYFIEKEMAKYGIEVKRYMNMSYRLFSPKSKEKNIIKQADGYVKYDLGADGTDSVGKGVLFAKAGFDGIVHLKPFGCMPEVNSMPMMQKISEDFKIPILYFSFDSQTSETGIKTRVEAFYDMLEMKRAGNKSK